MRKFDHYRARRVAGYLTDAMQLGTRQDWSQSNGSTKSIQWEANSPGRVLDLGCGRMDVACYLRNALGVDVIGLDIINVNQTSLPMCVGDALRLPFGDRSFDAVYLAMVLHHTTNPGLVLKECLRVSSKWVIVLEDIFHNSLEFHLLKALDWIGNRSVSADMPFPYNFKSEGEWLGLFSQAGAQVRAIETIRPTPWRPSRHRLFVLEPAYEFIPSVRPGLPHSNGHEGAQKRASYPGSRMSS